MPPDHLHRHYPSYRLGLPAPVITFVIKYPRQQWQIFIDGLYDADIGRSSYAKGCAWDAKEVVSVRVIVLTCTVPKHLKSIA